MKSEKNNPENKPSARHMHDALREDTGISWQKKTQAKIHENQYGHVIRYDVPGEYPFELWHRGHRVCGCYSLTAAKIIANVMINDEILNGSK